MKNTNYMRRKEFPPQKTEDPNRILYKYEKQGMQIENLQIRESISKKGKVIIEILHLPFRYKFDNFCEFSTYTEDYGNFKEKGFLTQLQPLKFKLR